MSAIIIVMAGSGVVPPDPAEAALLDEFEALVARLDLRTLDQDGWGRLQSILLAATLEAGDIERGAMAYDRALSLWRVCRLYQHD